MIIQYSQQQSKAQSKRKQYVISEMKYVIREI